MLLVRRHAAAVTLLGVLAAGAAACGGSSEPATSTTAKAAVSTTANGGGASGGGAKVAAPVMVELATAGGKVVSARAGQTVVLTTDKPTVWSGKVADASVATFVAGRNDGSATFNPALTDLRPGKTTVTLTDGSATVTFTLEVAA
jgi:hypothetical protein